MVERHPKIRYNTRLMREDMAARGWMPVHLAHAALKSPRQVGRFLNGEVQTAKMAAALATALGYSARRYLIRLANRSAA